MDPLNRSELRRLRALVRPGQRQRRGETIVEGWRAIDGALSGRATLHFAAATPQALRSDAAAPLIARLEAAAIPLRSLSAQTAREVCDTRTPQGVVAVAAWVPDPFPDPAPHAGLEARGIRSLLALDGVADPGNTGTLLRTAAAFGVGGALLGQGSVEVLSPRVVRGSAGTLFRLPWLSEGVDLPAAARVLAANGWQVYRAESGQGDAPAALPAADRWMLILGSEAHGISEGLTGVTRPVRIPMPGGTESLNVAVAGGILTYLLTLGGDRR